VERVEEYLEAIYDIQEKEKRVVRTNELAKVLNVKPSSVTEMLVKLKEKGYIEYQPYYGATLTKKGEEIAKKIKKYYTVFYKFFREFLGIDDETASRLSCELEHHLTEDAVSKVCSIIAGDCNICEKCEAVIRRLSEVENGEYEVVAFPSKLREIGLRSGARIIVEDDDVIIEGVRYTISREILKYILVK